LRDSENFGVSVKGMCSDFITDVEGILHENEAQIAKLEQDVKETTESYEKYLTQMKKD